MKFDWSNVKYNYADGKHYGIDEKGRSVEVVYDSTAVCYVLAPAEAWAREEQRLIEETAATKRADALLAARHKVVFDMLNDYLPRFDAGSHRGWVGTRSLASKILDKLTVEGYLNVF